MASFSSEAKLLFFLHLCFLISGGFSVSLTPAPAPSPTHHHHAHPPLHHHRHHLLAPTTSPVKSPIPSPVKPPTHLPPKPPTEIPAKPPTHSPVPSPTHSPVKSKPPTQQPSKPPTTPPHRQLVAVEGVVYCKNCTHVGVTTFDGAKPISGARVVMKCRNTKYSTKTITTTDKNGYFLLWGPKTLTTFGVHKCRVYLASAPEKAPCKELTDLFYGKTGAILRPQETFAPLPYALYNVGPFAFEPSVKSCKKQGF